MTLKEISIKPNTDHNRIIYLTAIILTILLGLASRTYSDHLPTFVAENSGDMLWAMMIYFGFRFLLVHKRPIFAIWFSILFSFGIEFSQLYQQDWINDIRNTTLGALILGKGFLIVDLVRYTIGVVFAYFLEKVIILKEVSK